MSISSVIELRNLHLTTDIGTYGPEDVVPEVHILDLVLTINPALVLIETDSMEHVFDYDPLIKEISRLAQNGHYETQERLITRILQSCATFKEIEAVEIQLRKTPVLEQTGELGIRLIVDERHMRKFRANMAA